MYVMTQELKTGRSPYYVHVICDAAARQLLEFYRDVPSLAPHYWEEFDNFVAADDNDFKQFLRNDEDMPEGWAAMFDEFLENQNERDYKDGFRVVTFSEVPKSVWLDAVAYVKNQEEE